VCDNWIERFESYYKHVASLPDFGKEGYTLDRTDNDGNYEPGNVRWASRSTQARNQRKRSTASGYRGVVLNERDEVYQARISLYLGSFKEKKDALSVVNCFIIKHGINNLEIQKWEG